MYCSLNYVRPQVFHSFFIANFITGQREIHNRIPTENTNRSKPFRPGLQLLSAQLATSIRKPHPYTKQTLPTTIHVTLPPVLRHVPPSGFGRTVAVITLKRPQPRAQNRSISSVRVRWATNIPSQ